MEEIAPLTAFVDRLLKSKQIKKLVADHYGPAAKERMKQFRSGEVDDLLELFEENKHDRSKLADRIDYAGPDEDTASIEIRTFGSVYWIEAIEYDSGYFKSSVDALVYASGQFEPYITELREREEREREDHERTSQRQDNVVTAVLSGASNAARLATQFTAEVGDPREGDFPEIASGGFVWRRNLKEKYEVYVEARPLKGRSRTQTLKKGAALTLAGKALYTKRKLAKFFAKPTFEGASYIIVAVTSSSRRTAYWAEIREGNYGDGIKRKALGIFPSVTAAKAALRRMGLISARDYRPGRHARGTRGRQNR